MEDNSQPPYQQSHDPLSHHPPFANLDQPELPVGHNDQNFQANQYNPQPSAPFEQLASPMLDSVVAPTPPEPPQWTTQPQLNPDSLMPQPVVRVLSPLGIEYVFMTITLFGSAVGLGSVIISLINGASSFDVLAFPTALLVASVPIFAWFFLRLKEIELNNPQQRLDASKRRSTQFIQIASFITCFFSLIGLLTVIFTKLAGQFSSSILKTILDVLVVELIAGGILFYYWKDEHKRK
jgi:hypothetical protein